jgi:hypothetical protein
VLHLLPGALITLSSRSPVARGLGVPSLMAILLAIPGPLMYSLFHQIGRPFPRFVHWCVCFSGAKRPSRQ